MGGAHHKVDPLPLAVVVKLPHFVLLFATAHEMSNRSLELATIHGSQLHMARIRLLELATDRSSQPMEVCNNLLQLATLRCVS